MIPDLLAKAASEGGWLATLVVRRGSKFVWCFFERGDLSVWVRRDRWRRTTARAYRGNRLASILWSQRDTAEFLKAAE